MMNYNFGVFEFTETNLTFFEVIFVIIECKKRKERKLYKNARTKFSAQFQFWRSLKSSFGTGLHQQWQTKA